jgi:hypothetical protein
MWEGQTDEDASNRIRESTERRFAQMSRTEDGRLGARSSDQRTAAPTGPTPMLRGLPVGSGEIEQSPV